MALSGKIRRKDGHPLGHVTDVKEKLSPFFPGINFIIAQPVTQSWPWGWNIIYNAIFFLNILFNPPHRRPYTVGNFSSNEQGWGAQFDLGGKPVVQEIRVTLYGSTASADAYFLDLDRSTGWIIHFV